MYPRLLVLFLLSISFRLWRKNNDIIYIKKHFIGNRWLHASLKWFANKLLQFLSFKNLNLDEENTMVDILYWNRCVMFSGVENICKFITFTFLYFLISFLFLTFILNISPQGLGFHDLGQTIGKVTTLLKKYA